MEVRIEDAPCGCPRFRVEPPLSDTPRTVTIMTKCTHSAVQPAAKKKATKIVTQDKE